VEGSWRSGTWRVDLAEGGGLVLSAGPADAGDGLDGLRALCVALWTSQSHDGAPLGILASDERAADALDAWGLARA
jgi:hypothetical protein